MIIGGLQKTSIIDFPGKISCVLFCAGCNFRCPYCHNPSLISAGEKPLLSTDAFFEFLKERVSFLDGVVITGGEPTLQKDLAELCAAIKDLGFAIKLDTNGSRPELIKALLADNLVDYLAMDIKTEPERYAPHISQTCAPETLLASMDLIKASGLAYEFRTTCIRPFVDSAIIERMADLVAGAPLHVLQHCRRENILDPDFFSDDSDISNAEMKAFQKIIEPKVGKCIIR